MKAKSLLKKCMVVLAFIFGLIGMTNLNAQEFTVGDLNYRINDDGVSVTVTGHVNGQNATGTLTIPESITYGTNSYVVTCIGEGAFSQCTGLSGSLTIPNSVTTIADGAFCLCSGFNGSLTIGNSVTEIGYSAFLGTGFIGELIIPNTVTIIYDHAFSSCNGFISLTIGDSVEVIGNGAFAHCSSLTGSLTIPNSVTSIGDGAFSSCSGFNGLLTIGNSVTYIGDNAFSPWVGFVGSLTIPNSVTYIGDNAFQDCSGFDGALTIGNSVTEIGLAAFYGCSGFTGSLTIPNSVTSIGALAFYECYGFNGTLTIGSSVSNIADAAFVGCWAITTAVSLATIPPVLHDEEIGGVFVGFGCTTLTVPCGCIPAYQNSDWSQYFTTIIEDCSDTEEFDENLASVYPNPTNGIIKIEAENIQNISIYNMLGEKVFATITNGDAFEYDFSNNESGVYLVRIETAIGIVTKRITVM